MGIKKIIRKLINWAQEDEASARYELVSSTASPRVKERHLEDGRGLNFTVYNASGGKVIQMNHYDDHLDRSISNLYIVTDKEDLGEELSHIITRESLTR